MLNFHAGFLRFSIDGLMMKITTSITTSRQCSGLLRDRELIEIDHPEEGLIEAGSSEAGSPLPA